MKKNSREFAKNSQNIKKARHSQKMAEKLQENSKNLQVNFDDFGENLCENSQIFLQNERNAEILQNEILQILQGAGLSSFQNGQNATESVNLSQILALLNALNENSRQNNENFETLQDFIKNPAKLYEMGLKALQDSQISQNIAKARDFIAKTRLIMSKLENKTLSKDELTSFLSGINYSFIGGAVLGGLLGLIINHKKE